MQIFRGTATNRIDAKGRVSIPARFRSIIEGDSMSAVYCHQSLNQPALEAGGRRLLNEVETMLQRINAYSDEYDALSHTLIGASEELGMDSEGRIILPEHFRDYAKLETGVTFVGLGIRFQLWNPDAYQKHLEEARKQSRALRGSLNAAPAAPAAAPAPGGAP